MAYHEKIKTTVKEIIKYHQINASELEMNVDICDLATRCWRCGEIRRLQRCHIVPASAGGEDTPSNYILLCNSCHEAAPNIKNSNRMHEWLRSSRSDTYDSFWGNEICIAYEQVYKKDLKKEIIRCYSKNSTLFNKIIPIKLTECKMHIGHGRLNISTWVAFWKNLFEEFDKQQTNQIDFKEIIQK